MKHKPWRTPTTCVAMKTLLARRPVTLVCCGVCLLNTVCWWTTLQSVDDLQKLRLQKRYGGLLVMIDAGTTDTLNWSSQSRALSRDKFESPSFCLGRPSRRDGAQIDTTVAFWSAQVHVLGSGSWWKHCKVTRTSFSEPLHHTALNQITGVGQDQKGSG